MDGWLQKPKGGKEKKGRPFELYDCGRKVRMSKSEVGSLKETVEQEDGGKAKRCVA